MSEKINMDKGTRDHEKAIKPTHKIIQRHKHAHTHVHNTSDRHIVIFSHMHLAPSTCVLLNV